MPEAPEELKTWKEIAAYLGVSLRKAQDSEAEGMPVHRTRGLTKGPVVAYRSELDRWRAERLVEKTCLEDGELPQAPSIPAAQGPAIPARRGFAGTPLGIIFIAIVALGTIALGAYYALPQPAREPSTFTVQGRLLTMFDEHNRPMWEHVFPASVPPYTFPGPDYLPSRRIFMDMRGAGNREFLIGVYDLLYCFRADGHLLWTHRPGREMTTRRGRAVPSYYEIQIVNVLSKPRSDGGRIVVGAHRGPSALFVVELLTEDGRKVGEYFHFGWLFASKTGVLDENGHEDIFLGGVDSAQGAPDGYGATLVVLNAEKVGGQAATLAGDERGLRELPTGREKAVVLIREFAPNPDPDDYCRGAEILLKNDALEFVVDQGAALQFKAHFSFDRRLKLRNVNPSIRLEQVLGLTLPKALAPVQRIDAMQRSLSDILYVRNDFERR